MFPDVMWYSGQSYPVIYQATRGLGLVKRLRCSSVFKQRYSFKGGWDKWEIRPVFSGNNGWATSNLFQENLLSVWSLRTGSLASLKIRGKDRIWELRVLFTRCMNAQNLPCFFSNSLIKLKIGLKMAYGNLAHCYHLRDKLAEFTPFI